MLLSQVGHVFLFMTWFGLASAQEFESLASKLLLVDEENDKDEAEDEEDEEEPLKEKF